VPVVSEIELFVRSLARLSPQARLIAITGSNGKTTTTASPAPFAGRPDAAPAVAGNIGPAALTPDERVDGQ
jgi:UDP-N-acetylmuramoylalanine--D-glutamate ligase